MIKVIIIQYACRIQVIAGLAPLTSEVTATTTIQQPGLMQTI